MTARRLILSLLNATGAQRMDVARLVAAGSAFGIEEAAMRMAATRLTRQAMLTSPERGVYASGAGAAPLREQVRGWQGARARRTHWDGGWIAMPGGHLGRTDRKRVAARERALHLFGFAEAEAGLWLRPSNLVVGLPDLRAQLLALGLDAEAMLWRIAETALPDGADYERLWDRPALEEGYRTTTAALKASMAGLDALPAAEAARETLLLGQAAIRRINLDPLLPEAMIDTALFDALVTAMEKYDRRGKKAWAQFYASQAQR